MAKVKVELTHPQEWTNLLNVIAQFNADVQSDELMVTVLPFASADVHEQANLLNKFRDAICPEVIDEASEIAESLKKNKQGFIPDPEESMSQVWDTYAEAAIPQFNEEIKSNTALASAVSNFWNHIGEAMGPICFAGFELKEVLDAAVLPKDWVDECIKYYMDNWKF